MDHEAARAAFTRFAEALDRHAGGRFFLIDGTLLGCIRDGGIVAGDNDIDLGMWIEDYDPALVPALEAEGFAMVRQRGTPARGLILKLRDGEVDIDVNFYYRSADTARTWLYRRNAALRSDFPLFTLERAHFLGRDVWVPAEPECYLERRYGPRWRQPVRAWNFRYGSHNLVAEGSLRWRLEFPLRRLSWRLRHPKLHLPKRPQEVVFTDGVFDLLHANHVAVIEEARRFGTRLVVGVATDALAASYKRPPVIPEGERLAMVRALRAVDYAFLLEGPLDRDRMRDVIETHNIAHVVYAGSSTPDFYAYAEELGIMRRLPYHDGVSTSAIIERIAAPKTRSDRNR